MHPQWILLNLNDFNIKPLERLWIISIPINIMLSEAREFPLYIRFNLYNLKFVYKIMTCKFSPRNSILFEIVVLQNNCTKPSAIHIYSISSNCTSPIYRIKDTCTALLIFRHGPEVLIIEISFVKGMLELVKSQLQQLTIASFYHASHEFRHNALSIYTDGSKDPEEAIDVGLRLV